MKEPYVFRYIEELQKKTREISYDERKLIERPEEKENGGNKGIIVYQLEANCNGSGCTPAHGVLCMIALAIYFALHK